MRGRAGDAARREAALPLQPPGLWLCGNAAWPSHGAPAHAQRGAAILVHAPGLWLCGLTAQIRQRFGVAIEHYAVNDIVRGTIVVGMLGHRVVSLLG